MNKTASNIILSLVVVSSWLFFGKPLQAQQTAPSLQKVLDEGLVAYKSLAEREATVEDSSSDNFLARSLLTYALLGVGQRQAVDDLFSDEATDSGDLSLRIPSNPCEKTTYDEVYPFDEDGHRRDKNCHKSLPGNDSKGYEGINPPERGVVL